VNQVSKATRTARRVYPIAPDTFNAGKTIKKYRMEADKTQAEFAELAGISVKELGRLETGKNEKVSFVTMVAIALSFDLPLQDVAEWFGIRGLRSFSRKGE
jgi:transcriptional regulator with XRE-family HTH domain